MKNTSASPSNPKKKFFRDTTVVSALSGLRILFSLGIYILIASIVGITAQADAFFIAFTIPAFFNSAIYNARQVLVSVFSRESAVQEKIVRQQFLSTILSLALVLLVSLSLLSYLLAPFVVTVIAPGSSSDTRDFAANLLQILSWMPIFTGLSAVSTAMLNAEQHFTITAFSELIVFLVAIIAGLSFPGSGIFSIAAGLVVGAILQLLVLSIACYSQLGFRYRLNFDYRQSSVVETARLVWVSVQGMMIRQGTPLTDRFFASFLPPGSIALIQYGARFTAPASLIFFDSIVAVTIPNLAKRIGRGDRKGSHQALNLGWRLITFVSLPMAAILLGLNYPLVSLLFQRGAFDQAAVQQVVPLSFVYNLSLLFWGYLKLQNAYLYATNDRKRVLQLFILITVTDIIIKAALLLFVGPLASAISFSMSVALTAIVGTYVVARSIGMSLSQLIQHDLGLIMVFFVILITTYVIATQIGATWSGLGPIADILAIIGGGLAGGGIFLSYILLWHRKEVKRLIAT